MGREGGSGVKDCSWRASSQEDHGFNPPAANRVLLEKKDVSNMHKAARSTM